VNNYILQPIPYLAFDGKCAEALDFYMALFGGKIVNKMYSTILPMGAKSRCRLHLHFGLKNLAW